MDGHEERGKKHPDDRYQAGFEAGWRLGFEVGREVGMQTERERAATGEAPEEVTE